MVAMFFTVSVINNYALNFNIAMPLHMIFRSVSISQPYEAEIGFDILFMQWYLILF